MRVAEAIILLLLGTVVGVLCTTFDVAVVGGVAVFTRLSLWILVNVIFATHVRNRLRAAWWAIPLNLGLVESYLLATSFSFENVSRSMMIPFGLLALVSPIVVLLAWTACHERRNLMGQALGLLLAVLSLMLCGIVYHAVHVVDVVCVIISLLFVFVVPTAKISIVRLNKYGEELQPEGDGVAPRRARERRSAASGRLAASGRSAADRLSSSGRAAVGRSATELASFSHKVQDEVREKTDWVRNQYEDGVTRMRSESASRGESRSSARAAIPLAGARVMGKRRSSPERRSAVESRSGMERRSETETRSTAERLSTSSNASRRSFESRQNPAPSRPVPRRAAQQAATQEGSSSIATSNRRPAGHPRPQTSSNSARSSASGLGGKIAAMFGASGSKSKGSDKRSASQSRIPSDSRAGSSARASSGTRQTSSLQMASSHASSSRQRNGRERMRQSRPAMGARGSSSSRPVSSRPSTRPKGSSSSRPSRPVTSGSSRPIVRNGASRPATQRPTKRTGAARPRSSSRPSVSNDRRGPVTGVDSEGHPGGNGGVGGKPSGTPRRRR